MSTLKSDVAVFTMRRMATMAAMPITYPSAATPTAMKLGMGTFSDTCAIQIATVPVAPATATTIRQMPMFRTSFRRPREVSCRRRVRASTRRKIAATGSTWAMRPAPWTEIMGGTLSAVIS